MLLTDVNVKYNEWCTTADWLAPVAGDKYRAACKYCSCILRAHYADLRHHMNSAKHARHAKWAMIGGGEPPVMFYKPDRKLVTAFHSDVITTVCISQYVVVYCIG